ncbi:MAG: hypothetical protein C4319_05585 [Acidimicrobiia bacterium]
MSDRDRSISIGNTRFRPRLRTALALLVVLAVGIAGILAAGWTRANYANPKRFYVHDLPAAQSSPAVSSRVVLVVSDGLRDDVARQLPNMSSLGRRPDAAFLRSVTGVPSLSTPGAINLLCGVGPVQSGFPLNESKGEVSVECLFETVAAAGLSSAVAGVGEGFNTRFYLPNTEVFARPSSPSHIESYVPQDFESFQATKKALQTKASFLYLYFPDVDELSHLYGALSRQGLDAAKIVDGFVGEIAATLDFSRDTLIVTSDHGHRDEGGHGGYEWLARRSPLLIVGRGIKGGSTADVAQSQIAPTIAALLGVPRPRHAEGMPLLEDLEVSGSVAESIRQAHEVALERKLRADLAKLSDRPAAPGDVEVLKMQISEAGWTRGVREGLRRTPYAIVLLGALSVCLAFCRALRKESLLGGITAAGVFAFFMWATGWRLTISQFNVVSDETRLTLALLGASAAGVFVGSLVSKISGRIIALSNRPFSEHLVATTSAAQGVAGLLVAWMLVYYGLEYSWRLPDLRLGLPTFWAMYASGFAAISAGVLTIVVWLASVARERRRKKRVDQREQQGSLSAAESETRFSLTENVPPAHSSSSEFNPSVKGR